jgi:hypothetical protein
MKAILFNTALTPQSVVEKKTFTLHRGIGDKFILWGKAKE